MRTLIPNTALASAALLFCLAGPALAAASSNSEIAEMRAQLKALQKYVKKLETRLDAQEQEKDTAPEKGAGRAEASSKPARTRKTDGGANTTDAATPAAAASDAGQPAAEPAAAGGSLQDIEANLGYDAGGRAVGAPPAGTVGGTGETSVQTPGSTSGGQPAAGAPATGSVDALASLEQQVDQSRPAGAPGGNARTAFNPQISIIGDFVYRTGRLPATVLGIPDGNGNLPGDANRNRFSFRELELAFQTVVDPWSRFDAFVTFPGVTEDVTDNVRQLPGQPVEIEEAYMTYTRLPYGLQLKGGKFRLEFGKENLAHTHSFFSIDRPRVITNFLSGDGVRNYGLSLQKNFAIGGPRTNLELTYQLLSDIGEDSLFAGIFEHRPQDLARARLYHEFDDSNNLDVGTSLLSGRWDEGLRRYETLHGYDLTYRYEPVSGAVYKKFIFRTEYLKSERELTGLPGAPASQDADGIYLLANYQFQRDMYVGARYDSSDAALMMAQAANNGIYLNHSRMWGPSVWYEWETTEFNRFKIQYSHYDTDFAFGNGQHSDDQLLLSWTITAGPHGAHKY